MILQFFHIYTCISMTCNRGMNLIEISFVAAIVVTLLLVLF
jgi:prepilin-type N-terminal cleavage/methylation domain-containing protein